LKNLVIFGTGAAGREIYIEFLHHPDPSHRVVAFAKDDQYVEAGEKQFGLPVVPFSEIENLYPPTENDMMIAVIDLKLMDARVDRYLKAQQRGYTLASCISSYATVWTGLTTGGNCFIGAGSIINPDAKIGDNVFISPGVIVSHNSTIGDHTFFSVGVQMAGYVTVESHAFFGGGAVVRNNVTIGHHGVLGTGAVILSDTEPYGVYMAQAAEKMSISSKQLMAIPEK